MFALRGGQYKAARSKFFRALQASGYRLDLSCNLAWAYCSRWQHAPALKHIADRSGASTSVGMTTEDIDVGRVGNTVVLHQTVLVEAFNLEAAIEYQLRNYETIRRPGSPHMPPRAEEEEDPAQPGVNEHGGQAYRRV